GSDPRVTVSLRRRIDRGELAGPAIYTAGLPIYPPKGIPYYIKREQPFFMQWLMPQPETPEAAVRIEERNIARGPHPLKRITGSYVERGNILPTPLPIARAAAEAARRDGQLDYSHPSNLAGTIVAIESGVDILAHTPDTTEGIDETLLRSIVDRNMAMI